MVLYTFKCFSEISALKSELRDNKNSISNMKRTLTEIVSFLLKILLNRYSFLKYFQQNQAKKSNSKDKPSDKPTVI